MPARPDNFRKIKMMRESGIVFRNFSNKLKFLRRNPCNSICISRTAISVSLCPNYPLKPNFKLVPALSLDRIFFRSYCDSNSTPEKRIKPDEKLKIIYVLANGQEVEVEGRVGENVMEIGVDNEIMEGACGGQLSCTTCHIYVDENIEKYFEEIAEIEEDLLDSAPFTKLNSRLGCQLYLTKEMDGTRFTLPPGTVNFYVDGKKPAKH